MIMYARSNSELTFMSALAAARESALATALIAIGLPFPEDLCLTVNKLHLGYDGFTPCLKNFSYLSRALSVNSCMSSLNIATSRS